MLPNLWDEDRQELTDEEENQLMDLWDWLNEQDQIDRHQNNLNKSAGTNDD